jgi:hypothetical protein
LGEASWAYDAARTDGGFVACLNRVMIAFYDRTWCREGARACLNSSSLVIPLSVTMTLPSPPPTYDML